MTAPPSLAVVISTYNKPDFLRLVLEGYRRQSDPDFSIYIADDGSAPETSELIHHLRQDFPVPVSHVWQQDDGFRKARIHNETIRRIREPQTLLTDGDCIPLPEMVAAHRRFARPDAFISGRRILLSRQMTARLVGLDHFPGKRSIGWWLRQRAGGNINRLLPLLLPPRLSDETEKLEGIRGCHLACPTEALIRINGFDESYEGWGREDSDLTARLLHAGYKRRNLSGPPVLHLWHEEFSRRRLDMNDTMLQACLNERRIEATKGLRQLAGNIHA